MPTTKVSNSYDKQSNNGSTVESLNAIYTVLEPDQPMRSERLSVSDQDAILNMLAQLREQLPFLRDLTAEQRRASLGMGNKNRIFAGKVLEVVRQTPDFLPRNFDMDQFQTDLETFDRLSPILMSLTQLRDLIDATMTAIGTDAYEQALNAYRHAKASGQGASLDGMMAEMSQRFNRKSKKKAEDLSTSPDPTEG
jgi:hypothetical protein